MTIRRSVLASVIGRYAILAIQIVASMVMARLLTPAELGVWAAAQSAILLSVALRNFGASDYLLRSKEIDSDVIGRVMGLMLTISVVCALVLFLSRGLIAAFFGEPKLAPLLALLTFAYLLMPLGLGALVLLEKELAFVKLQAMQIVGTVLSGVTAITLAYMGFSFYSLAWAQLVQIAALVAMQAIAKPHAVFCRPKFRGWGSILNFGLYSTGIGLVGQASAQSVTAIIGRVLGLPLLGYYDRANGVSSYAQDVSVPVVHIVYIGLARVKDQPKQFAELFLTSLANLTGTLWPAYALMAVLSLPIILVLFGDQWTPAAPAFSVICLGLIAYISFAIHIRVLVAVGQIRSVLLVELLGLTLRIPAVLLLSRFGLFWAAFGIVVPTALTSVLYWQIIRAHILISRTKVLAVLGRSSVVMGATILGPLILRQSGMLATWTPVAVLLVCALVGATGWLISVAVAHPPLRHELALIFAYAKGLIQPPARPDLPTSR